MKTFVQHNKEMIAAEVVRITSERVCSNTIAKLRKKYASEFSTLSSVGQSK